MNRKQVASWIVTTVLIAGTGAALAEGGDAGSDPTTTDTTVTTVVSDTTTTAVVEDTTTTTVDESTTTTVADTTDTTVASGTEADGETDGGGNSAAAHNHDCDEAWGNHGAWVSANAHARKTGDEVSCDGPSTTTTVVQSSATTDTTDTTVAPTSDTSTATETTASSHGNGHGNAGHGSRHGKDG